MVRIPWTCIHSDLYLNLKVDLSMVHLLTYLIISSFSNYSKNIPLDYSGFQSQSSYESSSASTFNPVSQKSSTISKEMIFYPKSRDNRWILKRHQWWRFITAVSSVLRPSLLFYIQNLQFTQLYFRLNPMIFFDSFLFHFLQLLCSFVITTKKQSKLALS